MIRVIEFIILAGCIFAACWLIVRSINSTPKK